MLEQKQVTLNITFYCYIFLVYHLVLLIFIVSYDELDMNSTWFIRTKQLYKTTYEPDEMNKTKRQLPLYNRCNTLVWTMYDATTTNQI